jgi:hypothetical protein
MTIGMRTRRHAALTALFGAALLLPQPVLAQFVQQGPKLSGTGDPRGLHGWSVSVSGDGNTAIVGAWLEDSGEGAAFVWTRHSGAWSQQGPKLVGSASGRLGWSVAVSADGNTAIAAAPDDEAGIGAALVWTRSGSGWTQQGPKLVGSGSVAGAGHLMSVAISADGNTAIVGGNAGTWIWTRSGGVWTQQGPGLGSPAVSVSLSGDGNTALAGLNGALVWTRNAGVWTRQGPKLFGAGAAGEATQGWSVSLSADGNSAIVGGPTDDGTAGAAWVWERKDGVWSQQGPKLVGSGAVGGAAQGVSVSLSADGNSAIVGGPDDGAGGAVWVWMRSGDVWTQQGSKLVGSGAVGPSLFGNSVALSGDGTTAIVGGPLDDASDPPPHPGAIWVFVSFPSPVSPLPDMDGDGTADLALWSGSTGLWSWLTTASGFNSATVGSQQWGNKSLGDVPLTGDIDGDRIDDLIVWRASTGEWFWVTSSSTFHNAGTKQWGAAGDIPIAADIDGDNRVDLVVWRPSTGTWYWLTSSSGYSYASAGSRQWGNTTLGDVPLAGHFDGDGKADLAIWRASTGTWYWLTSSSGYNYASAGSQQWGNQTLGDVPLLADFDGDRKADLAVWRASTGTWYWLRSSSGYATAAAGSVQWGSASASDIPLVGDIDGDGLTDLTVWRASTGTWFWLTSSSGYSYTAQRQKQWGG